MDLFIEHWDEIEDSKAFQENLEKVTSGQYPDRGKVLVEIFKRVAKRNVEE